MSGGYRFKRSDALVAAEALLEQIASHCEQVQLAGSLRRGKNSVGDIELVALPVVEEREIAPVPAQLSLFGEAAGGATASVERVSLLDQRLDHLVATEVVFRERPYTHQKGVWGAKRKQFWLPVHVDGNRHLITVDLYIVTPPAQWGPIFTIRTGDADFVGRQGLMKYINTRTPFQQTDGRLIVRATGEDVPTPTERDYFEALNLPWIEPRDRTVAKLWKVAAGRRVPSAPTGNGFQMRDEAEIESTSAEHPYDEDRPAIKAITIHQPWASLIAAGVKEYETRSWETGYRGLIAIHAGQTKTTMRYVDFECVNADDLACLPDPMPLGAVVAVARLVDCVLTTRLLDEGNISDREYELGNFAPGRFGWKLEIVTVFDEPIPARGQQGLWKWDGWDGVIGGSPGPKQAMLTGNISSQVRVVNVKSLPKTWQNDPAYADHVYIGRAHRAKKLPGSVWGNPFVVGRDGNRAQVIEKYRAWIETQPHLLQMIPHLATQTGALVCWCAPLPCHGDVLCEYIERWRRGEWQPPPRKGSMGYNDSEARTQMRERLKARAGLV